MSVKDGLPSTDFSRMNREWVKAVAGGGGGTALPPVTEADNGRILGVVNGEWGAMDVGGGSSDFSTATITIIDPDELMEAFYCSVIVDGRADYQFKDDPSDGITVILYDGAAVVGIEAVEGTTITRSGNVIVENHQYIVTGDATFTFSVS